MQQGINNSREKLLPRGPHHPRNLDPALPACYLAAEAFLFWHLTGERIAKAVFSGGKMKITGLLVLLLATAAWAQTTDPATFQAPEGTTPTTNSFPVERIPTP